VVEGHSKKVGECLYRYSSSGVTYGRIKVRGKEYDEASRLQIVRLRDDKLTALKDAEAEVDHAKGKLTLAELCDQYLRTVQHLLQRRSNEKLTLFGGFKEDWPGGSSRQVARSNRQKCRFGLANMTLAGFTKSTPCLPQSHFHDAVEGPVITRSPAAGVPPMKLSTPIREPRHGGVPRDLLPTFGRKSSAVTRKKVPTLSSSWAALALDRPRLWLFAGRTSISPAARFGPFDTRPSRDS
jgi:hypothetical protein